MRIVEGSEGSCTEVGQSGVVSSPSLVEGLVGDGQPLDLVGEHAGSVLTQQALVHLIQSRGVLIVDPDLATGVLDDVDGEAGTLHLLGGVGPPGPLSRRIDIAGDCCCREQSLRSRLCLLWPALTQGFACRRQRRPGARRIERHLSCVEII